MKHPYTLGIQKILYSPKFSTQTRNNTWKWLVVHNTHIFAPYILNGAPPQVCHFDYQDGEILSYSVNPLPESLGNQYR